MCGVRSADSRVRQLYFLCNPFSCTSLTVDVTTTHQLFSSETLYMRSRLCYDLLMAQATMAE